MAVTSTTYKKPEEQNKQQTSQYPSQGYTGLAGVSENTAKQLGQYQNGYKPSQNVTAAQQQLQQVQTQKPQGYNSKYGPALENLIQQIQNPKEFKYSFDGDEMFKNYADVYSQNARQASMDAMGQAAALTGGYGNSYAQQVGNKMYNETMRPLYEIGMQLQQAAYNRYRDDQADLLNRYDVISGEDEKGYSRYRDTVADWLEERNYATDLYDTESDRDYSRFANDREFLMGLAKVENADYRSEQERQEAIRQYEQDYAREVLESDRAFNEQVRQEDLDEAYRRDTLNWQKDTDQRDYERSVLESDRAFEENVRQYGLDYALKERQIEESIREFNESLNWDKMSAQQKYAAEYAMQILANGQMPSEELLQQAGLSAEDAAKMMAVLVTGGAGTGKKDTGDTGGNVEPMSYGEAATYVLQNTPQNTPLSSITGNKNDTRTLQDLSNSGSIDITRIGKNSDLTDAQKTQAVKNAVSAINNGAAYHNSAADYANKVDTRSDVQKAFQDTSINDLLNYKINKVLPTKKKTGGH